MRLGCQKTDQVGMSWLVTDLVVNQGKDGGITQQDLRALKNYNSGENMPRTESDRANDVRSEWL